jgi:hypothetical protein
MVALMAIATVAMSEAVAAAEPPITVTAVEGIDGCAFGTAPANTNLTISIKTSSGELRSRERLHVSPFAEWESCTTNADPLNAHDRIIIESPGHRMVFNLALLTVKIDRATGFLGGRAPANAALDVATSESKELTHVRANAQGYWRLPGKHVLQAFQFAGVRLVNGAKTLEAVADAPGVQITRADNVLRGQATTLAPIQIRLLSPSGSVRSAVTVQSNGLLWTATLVDGQGRATYPESGDTLTISIEPGARFTIPDGAIHGDASKNRLSGRCMPGARYLVDVQGTNQDYLVRGVTNSAGLLRQHLNADLTVGWDLTLECFYPTGDVYIATNIAH